MPIKWKERILALNESARIHKMKNVPLEKACDYVLVNYQEYCENVEAMTKKEFEQFVKDAKEFV